MFLPHLEVYRLLCWRNLLLTVMLFCFSYVVASESRLVCVLTSCFYLGALEQFLCTCLPYGFVHLLVYALWQPWMFSFGRKFVVRRSAITVTVLHFSAYAAIIGCVEIRSYCQTSKWISVYFDGHPKGCMKVRVDWPFLNVLYVIRFNLLGQSWKCNFVSCL
jgi:hypothetical protein